MFTSYGQGGEAAAAVAAVLLDGLGEKAVMTDNPSSAASWFRIAQATLGPSFCSPAVPFGIEGEREKDLSGRVHIHTYTTHRHKLIC